jgi:hypothetical protein
MDVPVTGTNGSTYAKAGSWSVGTSYRWQKSDTHFVGSEEQHEREAESSQVINRIHITDLNVRYNLSPRTSFSLGVPFFFSDRSSPVRNQTRAIIDRSVVQTKGISDITLAARRWMLSDQRTEGNFSLGLGIKLPTGKSNATDLRKQFVGGQVVQNVFLVDQSIQPGDSGFGFFTELSGFRRLGRFTAYGSGTYLFNPKEENHKADRGGTNPLNRYLSVGDQYIARAGLATTFHKGGAWTLNVGGRLEGMPAEDLIGGSNGFRRPGYAISIEPGITFSKGRSSFNIGVPWAVYRNRTRNVSDKASGGHGDAAFADYLLIAGFSRSF